MRVDAVLYALIFVPEGTTDSRAAELKHQEERNSSNDRMGDKFNQIKLAFYLHPKGVLMGMLAMRACLQTSENDDKCLVRETQICHKFARHEPQSS